MSTARNAFIPPAVLDGYFDRPPKSISQLSGGIINQTFLIVDSDDRRSILQRLNPLFSEQTIQDFSVISKHLLRTGWLVQDVIFTRQNEIAFIDASGGVWRLLSYIEGIDAPENMTENQLFEVGALLAKLHNDLRELRYIPTFKIPDFHDTHFYATGLSSVQSRLSTQESRQLADDCLRAIESLTQPFVLEKQLIHGDPRTTNILFKDSSPVAYIDFDTIMLDSPWIDIGDILRSINGSKDQTVERFSYENTRHLMRGYYSYNTFDLPFDDFFQGALISMQLICIELAMRFTTDLVHDNYFGWDPNLFKSRRENNLVRAKAQWNIYEKVCSKLN